jgi:nicotinate-nucleotide adenylyltransferase
LKNKKIGLYFGSFNPIHVGHLLVANYIAEFGPVDEVWLVVSPQNPFKTKESLLSNHHRLQLVNLAIGDYPKLKASSIEFDLPTPSYTVITLAHLSEKYPTHQFYLIMGSDNLENFHKWKNYEAIIEHYHILVYPRNAFKGHSLLDNPKFTLVNAPEVEISSSFIRQAIHDKKDVRHFLTPAVWDYVKEMHFYEK